MNPLISVVVTTYNQAPYIEQALQSVFAQTYKPYEVIVVDDGSTDDTPSRITPFGSSVIYIRQSNQGIAASRNTGISKARGEFIAFLDGDDLWDPEKLSVQAAAAQRYPNSGLIAVDGLEFNDNGILGMSLFGPCCNDLPEGSVTTDCYYHQLLHKQFILTTSQVMIPAKVFQTIGLSNKRFKRASDYDLYIRIAAKYKVTIVKKRLAFWRCLETSASGPRHRRGLSYLPEAIAILKNHLHESDKDDRALICRIIESRLTAGAENLYYYGQEVNKAFATRILLKLFAGNLAYPTVAAFLAGLWCPRVITEKLGSTVRKILVPNHNE